MYGSQTPGNPTEAVPLPVPEMPKHTQPTAAAHKLGSSAPSEVHQGVVWVGGLVGGGCAHPWVLPLVLLSQVPECSACPALVVSFMSSHLERSLPSEWCVLRARGSRRLGIPSLLRWSSQPSNVSAQVMLVPGVFMLCPTAQALGRDLNRSPGRSPRWPGVNTGRRLTQQRQLEGSEWRRLIKGRGVMWHCVWASSHGLLPNALQSAGVALVVWEGSHPLHVTGRQRPQEPLAAVFRGPCWCCFPAQREQGARGPRGAR